MYLALWVLLSVSLIGSLLLEIVPGPELWSVWTGLSCSLVSGPSCLWLALASLFPGTLCESGARPALGSSVSQAPEPAVVPSVSIGLLHFQDLS